MVQMPPGFELNLDASGEYELIRESYSELTRLELGEVVNWFVWLENDAPGTQDNPLSEWVAEQETERRYAR